MEQSNDKYAYALNEFEYEEDFVSAVPISWIDFNSMKCKWPKKQERQAILKSITPKTDWVTLQKIHVKDKFDDEDYQPETKVKVELESRGKPSRKRQPPGYLSDYLTDLINEDVHGSQERPSDGKADFAEKKKCERKSTKLMKKWKGVRDTFMKSMKKKTVSGQGASNRKYIYAKQMECLLHCGILSATISIDEDTETQTDEYADDPVEEINVAASAEPLAGPSSGQSPPPFNYA
ncbi:hypothetical protein RN001_014732 [Aquatica leii]|uniref:Uncharacterized protein n=1 Tax=Aquatica leii TaxID=1421715 RepID=A0AAN7QC04_9COLE|nr:hypothetical protein RN001_014732 [Aquatica leii]